jgi:hypothetical protein
MTVKDLIALLNDLEKEREIYISGCSGEIRGIFKSHPDHENSYNTEEEFYYCIDI